MLEDLQCQTLRESFPILVLLRARSPLQTGVGGFCFCCIGQGTIGKAKLIFSLAAFNVSKLLFELQNQCFHFTHSASPHPCLSACLRTTGVLPSRDTAPDAMQRLVRIFVFLDLFKINFDAGFVKRERLVQVYAKFLFFLC